MTSWTKTVDLDERIVCGQRFWRPFRPLVIDVSALTDKATCRCLVAWRETPIVTRMQCHTVTSTLVREVTWRGCTSRISSQITIKPIKRQSQFIWQDNLIALTDVKPASVYQSLLLVWHNAMLSDNYNAVIVAILPGDVSENDRLFGKESDSPGNGADQMALYEVSSVQHVACCVEFVLRLIWHQRNVPTAEECFWWIWEMDCDYFAYS